ncbi:MAG: transglycosylase SLT domain-containing protein [Chryseolinea sp.]
MNPLKLIVFAVFGFVLYGCGHKAEKTDVSLSRMSLDSQALFIFAPPQPPQVIRRPPARVRYPLKRKKLKVLTLHSINTYFLVDGEEHGLEYELLQLYARQADLAVDIITVENYKAMYDSIAKGDFDMAMGTLFVNSAMDSITPFSNTIYYSDVILVTSESIGDTTRNEPGFSVIHQSPVHFWMHGKDSIVQSLRDPVRSLESELSKEVALELVARKEFKSLLVDRHDYLIMRSFFPELKEYAVLQREQPIAFAFNPHSEALKDDFNNWHTKHKKSSDYQYTLKKYRDHSDYVNQKLKYEIPVIMKGIISPYDSLIRIYATREAFDWKLIAAIIHQESRFRPLIVSPVGAFGLMQLMPSVAQTYKINFKKLSSPDLNISTGTKYFRWLYKHFDKPEYSNEDKIKFTLASYNAGIGHIMDAKALALKYNLNPYVWNDNVEDMLLKKSTYKYYSDPVVKFGHCRGFETRIYVRNIMQYYEHYQNFLPVETL